MAHNADGPGIIRAMQAITQHRIKSALLWLVVVVLWVAMYPAFHLSKMEVVLVLLSLFFFFGVQKFEGDAADIQKAVDAGLPLPMMILPARWLKRITRIFLLCGIACILAFVFYRAHR